MTTDFVPPAAPLPWFKSDNAHELRPTAIHAANGGIVATTWRIGDHEANAEYILRACNNFPTLLEACEACLHLAELYHNQPRLDGLVAHALNEMRHLLTPRIANAKEIRRDN